VLARKLKRSLTIGSGENAKTIALKVAAHQVTQALFVVDDQHSACCGLPDLLHGTSLLHQRCRTTRNRPQDGVISTKLAQRIAVRGQIIERNVRQRYASIVLMGVYRFSRTA
jgi:hypothetical protein